MIDYATAKSMLLARLRTRRVGDDEGLAILEELTERKPYGWVLYYNSRRFVETRNPLDALVGAGPVVVLEATGDIHELGSARPPAAEVEALEQKLGLRAG